MMLNLALLCGASSSALAAPPVKEAPTAKGTGKLTGTNAQLAPQAKPTAKAKPPVRVKMMVPPPPPNVPTISALMQSHESLLNGVILDYLSKADLERLRTRLQDSLSKEKKSLSEHEASMEEKKRRATQFESLFKEGVVSRKELEAARKDFSEVDTKDKELSLRVSEVQDDLTRVEKQLAKFKNEKPANKTIASPAPKKTAPAAKRS